MNILNECLQYNDCRSFIGIILISPITLTWIWILNLSLSRYKLFLLIVIISLFLCYLLQKYLTKNNILLLWCSLWILWFWMSIWVGDILWYHHWFPIQSRDYPSCWACWSDSPEISTLWLSIVNLLIWQITATIASSILKWRFSQKAITILVSIGLWITLIWFWYLSVAFD